eukprot:s2236_g11.t1
MELLTFKASAKALAPSSPMLLRVKSMFRMDLLTFNASAKAFKPSLHQQLLRRERRSASPMLFSAKLMFRMDLLTFNASAKACHEGQPHEWTSSRFTQRSDV